MSGLTRPLPTRLVMAALLGGVLLLSSVACSPKQPSDPAGITGQITSIEKTAEGASMLVEGGEQPAGAVSDKAMCRIDGKTTIQRADGSEATVDDLTVGTNVRVWFTGAVAESYPVQGTASFVVIDAK